MGLQIAPSLIPNAGYGLYTTRSRVKGENIVRYSGQIVLELEDDDEPFSGPYVLMVKKTYPRVYIDARESSNTGGFVNSARGTKKKANCQFVYDSRNQVAWVRARTAIPAGTELYIGYGAGYWR